MLPVKRLVVVLGGLAAVLFSGCAPTASFTADPTGGPRPLTVAFKDASSTRVLGFISLNEIIPITQWNWSFGDGTGSLIKDPSHRYDEAGTYTVSLTVSNAFGSETITRDNLINVQLPTTAPVSSFTFAVGDDPFTVEFTDTSTPGSRPITEWQWDFGDGTGSTQRNPSHTYAEAGTYEVNLQVRTVVGTNASERTLNIPLNLPEANFTFARAGELSVRFTDTSVAGGAAITKRKWTLGDGTITEGGATLTHVYDEAGTYNVILEVTTSLGVDTVTKAVAVPIPE
jgi:PKD repeat protein